MLREPMRRDTSQNKHSNYWNRLAIRPGKARQLYGQYRFPPQKPRRLQVVLKQVVGTPFSSRVLSTAEDEIVSLMVKVSSSSQTDQAGSIIELRDKLKALLSPWVSIYLQSIASRLLDPQVALTWHAAENNCKQFCESLLDYQLFGPLVSRPSVVPPGNGPIQPLYRVSFLCRPGIFTQPPFTTPETITDVPYGLTEEYLRRFWFGCSNGPNLIDSLQEYWFDWAGFNMNIYRHQHLFPWDCTEALFRYPGKCGECNLAKHLWAFPFDSWSIIALHLSQDRYMYPRNVTAAGKDEDVAWTENRLALLNALDILCTGATAMSQEPLFHKATEWLHTQTDLTVERVRMGGIHRAQPRSYALEKRRPSEFFIAWPYVSRKQRKQHYEQVRELFRSPEIQWDLYGTDWWYAEQDNDYYQFPPIPHPISHPAAIWPFTPVQVIPLRKHFIPNAGFTPSSGSPDSHGACGTQSTAAACGSNCGSCDGGGCGGGGCSGGCGGGGCGGGSGGGGGGGGG
ncbi:hypothetical protein N7474_009400 [Penicillium riverlandense]|uniref:uncharacterized protein n=1 Tax=Penicillium riverlandense TaxID=1903569 RepID=UPI002548EBB5|nr:uncharacterized protein N7474_009400 [Penicillium riverlandense]KAJ5808131.1 hypothetical protein N7474_009400 [Penicillium riverlandense]